MAKKTYTFGEKSAEYYARAGKEIPVWQTPKYKVAKDKAVEMIESDKYDLSEADFWILMNATKKADKMMYSGLIISHNGCLKINDNMPPEKQFKPECVTRELPGYGGALVYTYCCPEQGIYEVGEVTSTNCKNEYPYAMALKRMYDRVVLKLSKLAYSGVYSDSESDEFAQRLEASGQTNDTPAAPVVYATTDELRELRDVLKTYSEKSGRAVTISQVAKHMNCTVDKFPKTAFESAIKAYKNHIARMEYQESANAQQG